MNLLNKLWNKIVDTYYNIYEWLYIRLNKTTYWEYNLTNGTAVSEGVIYFSLEEYNLTNGTVYCSVSEEVIYISLEDYRLMESDSIGRIVLKDLKEGQVPIKVVV